MKTTRCVLVGLFALSSSVAASAQEPAKAGAGGALTWETRLKDSGWAVQGPSRLLRSPQQAEPGRWLTAQYSRGALYFVLVDLQCSASLILDATAKEKLKSLSDAEPVTRRLGSNLTSELPQSRAYAEVIAYVAAATGSGAEPAQKNIRAWIAAIDWASVPVVNDDESHDEDFQQVPGLPSIRILAKRSTISIGGERLGLAAINIRTLEK